MFTPVPPDTDFVALEQAELARWATHRVFERSVEQREGAPKWVFYEGPPTANGMPGLHHVWARVYKDLFCRFHAMRGSYVARRGGWDTHGLPVEVEVEKKLGITGKKQIEDQVGIAEFVRLCRESVYSYVDEFTRLTTRIGYWLDTDAAYWTLSPSYIESVWWHLRQLFDQGLLYEDLKVVPYCPRCGTALSSHELGQPGVYTDEEDESAYVRFPIIDPDPACLGEATALAVWTTTPWTLLSNTGVAVNPGLTYAVVDGMIMAADLVDDVLGEGASARISRRLSGADLVGLRYRAPLRRPAGPRPCRRVAGRARGLRHHRGGHGPRASRPGLRRDRPPDRPRERAALPQPRRPRRTFHRRDRVVGGAGRAGEQHADQRPASGRRTSGAPLSLRALVPALLALPYPAHLLGQAELVHRHLHPQGPDAGRERHHRLAPGAHPRRAVWRMAVQQRRLGALARPLLGHAAAHLAVRARASALHQLALRALRALRPRRHGHRSAPAGHRRGRVRLPDVRGSGDGRRGRRGPAGGTGHRRLVRFRVHAGGPGRLPPHARIRRVLHLPG